MEGVQTETVLVVDVWSDYAHFRIPYTPSSPLTFIPIPRTALAGLIAAIIGLGKDEYLEHFTRNKASLAVALAHSINGVVKTHIPENFIDTKDTGSYKMCKIKNHTQINLEVVYRPRYRIFVRLQDRDLYDILKENLIHHRSFYTPYLGISEFIANFAYVGEFACTNITTPQVPIEIASVVPIDELEPNSIVFEASQSDNQYLKERMPGEMFPGRITMSYDDILYEQHGNPIKAKPKTVTVIQTDPPTAVMWL
jgi:CRISPR-associated protein Cas5h